MKTGIVTMPLDTGRVPAWLFERMTRLMRVVAVLMVEEFGPEEFLRRLSDPFWFQAISCAIGMDWNSSGTTPITLGALKEAIRGAESELGIYVCGGKGKTSKKTPEQLQAVADRTGLEAEKYIRLSRLVAKIDNSLIQDGFQLYHHSFLVSTKGNWAVIQQGMNTNIAQARRYHWNSDFITTTKAPVNYLSHKFKNQKSKIKITRFALASARQASQNSKIDDGKTETNPKDLTTQPHTGIVSNVRLKNVMDLTNRQSAENKKLMVELMNQPQDLFKDLKYIYTPRLAARKSASISGIKSLFMPDIEFYTHPVVSETFDTKRLKKIIAKTACLQPQTIEDLLLVQGIGPRTIRAVSLVAELIYNKPVAKIDPARYTFAHGGKDGTPYPVDRATYDQTIQVLNRALRLARQTPSKSFKPLNYVKPQTASIS